MCSRATSSSTSFPMRSSRRRSSSTQHGSGCARCRSPTVGASVPSWIGRNGRPLVYLTLGTVVATDDGLRPAIEGLASLDVDVLVALGAADGAALGDLPPNVHLEAFVDQPACSPPPIWRCTTVAAAPCSARCSPGCPSCCPRAPTSSRTPTGWRPRPSPPCSSHGRRPVSVAAAAARLLDGMSPSYDSARAEAVRTQLVGQPAPAEVVAHLAARFAYPAPPDRWVPS